MAWNLNNIGSLSAGLIAAIKSIAAFADQTSAPNDTTTVASLAANGDADDIDVALVPKGIGALLAQVPDGTSAGGSKRGANAVDLQTIRVAESQIASGSHASVGGGNSNTASNIEATVAGGKGNIASGLRAACGGGLQNTVDGKNSCCPGGTLGNARGIAGAHTIGCPGGGLFFSLRNSYGFGGKTTNATPKVLTTDSGATPTAANQIVLTDNTVIAFEGRITCRDNAANVSMWKVHGVIKCDNTFPANTSIVGAVTVDLVAQDSALSTAAVAVDADTTIGCFRITVTGIAATEIYWVAEVFTVESSS